MASTTWAHKGPDASSKLVLKSQTVGSGVTQTWLQFSALLIYQTD